MTKFYLRLIIINVDKIWINDLYGDIRIHKIIKLIVDKQMIKCYNKRVVRVQGGF